MAEKSDSEEPRLKIPLDPEEALRALLKVDPESEPVEDRGADKAHAERKAGKPNQPG